MPVPFRSDPASFPLRHPLRTQPTSEESAAAPAVTSRHVARGLGTTVLARLGAMVEIVAAPLYVPMVGLVGYGLYAVLWAAINLLEEIFDTGMTSAMQRIVQIGRAACRGRVCQYG